MDDSAVLRPEIYARVRWPWLRAVIHAVNNAWFSHVTAPGPAVGNILVFNKRQF
jgi:hypothetical protein